MPAPRTGPCTPWVQGSDLVDLEWVKAASQKWLAAGEGREQDDLTKIFDDAADAASEILYEMSGRIFTGGCGPVTVRPLSRPLGFDYSMPGIVWSSSWGYCSFGEPTGVMSHFGCSNPPEIDLGAYPITEITEVKIDGVVIPPDEYELRDFKTLVRILPTVNAVPTERYGWPTCQNNDLPDTQEGTFSVTYKYGQTPPTSGVLAAKKLAEYLALPQLGDTTKYPQRVTSIQRQGVSSMVVDVMDIVKTGKTGIYEVDLFLRSVNPKQASRQAAVFSPDLGRARRTANPS